MKLQALLIGASCLVANAFGVTPATQLKKVNAVQKKPAFKGPASNSPLFRDPSVTRGGAVPGWAAYNEALDKKPLITKAFTSLAGFALGDAIAQVSYLTRLLSSTQIKEREKSSFFCFCTFFF